MALTFDLDGLHFASRKALEAAVKHELQSCVTNQHFRNRLLEAVINELHPDVVAAGQKATMLEYITWHEQKRRGIHTSEQFRGGHLMTAYFEPLGEWRDVTVYPWRKGSNRQKIKKAFRLIIAIHIPRPKPSDTCDVPDCAASWKKLEYHHLDPTFDEIVNECIDQCSQTEIETLFGYNKFNHPPDTYSVADVIPDDHPAVRHLVNRHQVNQWVWRCAYHHRGVQKEPSAQLRLTL